MESFIKERKGEKERVNNREGRERTVRERERERERERARKRERKKRESIFIQIMNVIFNGSNNSDMSRYLWKFL